MVIESLLRDVALTAIDEIYKLYRPEFIVLYGSLARGDATEKSDIDIACFGSDFPVSKDCREFMGKRLDCWLYDIGSIHNRDKSFLRFIGGELFFDKNETGMNFLKKLETWKEEGPEKLSTDERQHLHLWSQNMLERAGGADIESRFRRAWLPVELLEIYFQLRDQWYFGSKQAFAWLKENDVETNRLFDAVFENPSDLDSMKALLERVLID